MSKPSGRAEQAGVIAFRRSSRGLEVCLIRKAKSPWSIPKGLIEHGDTQRATAVREAWEEAGIRGRIVGRALGRYRYDKWGDTLTVAVYQMNVRLTERRWPESDVRRRQWMSANRAAAALRRHPARPLLKRMLERLKA